MNQATLVEYFNNPYDSNNVHVQYVNLWCKNKIQEFVERHMDDTNFRFFGKIFRENGCTIHRFKHDKWLTDDDWVYNSIVIDYRKLAEMSNKNVRILAQFIRMNYFQKFMEYNRNTIDNPFTIFQTVFDTEKIRPKTKRVFK
jgi:hypothetical protein